MPERSMEAGKNKKEPYYGKGGSESSSDSTAELFSRFLLLLGSGSSPNVATATTVEDALELSVVSPLDAICKLLRSKRSVYISDR